MRDFIGFFFIQDVPDDGELSSADRYQCFFAADAFCQLIVFDFEATVFGSYSTSGGLNENAL